MTDRDQQIHDVLIKASEDVQQGMWCEGSWFTDVPGEPVDSQAWAVEEVFNFKMTVETLSKLHRCAEGSIALATIMAGLDESAYNSTVEAVDKNLPDHCGTCEAYEAHNADHALYEHNDSHMAGMSQFDAGQHLSEIFRDTADRVLQS